jgi:hypothetical protein
LEVVAQIALDSDTGDEITRIMARSILTTADHLSELVRRSDKFQPLVYTILLALDKRLYTARNRANGRSWNNSIAEDGLARVTRLPG